MVDDNNHHTADSPTAVMAEEAMVPEPSLTNLLQVLLASSTNRSVTMELVDLSIIKPTLEMLAFPGPVRASHPSTSLTNSLLSSPVVVDMDPEEATVAPVAMAATEDSLPVLAVASVMALVVATVAMATKANKTSTATMSARRLATVASLATAKAPTKMSVLISTKIDATMLTNPSTSGISKAMMRMRVVTLTRTGFTTTTTLQRQVLSMASTKTLPMMSMRLKINVTRLARDTATLVDGEQRVTAHTANWSIRKSLRMVLLSSKAEMSLRSALTLRLAAKLR